MTTNPYEKFTGYGRVSGREKIFELNAQNQEASKPLDSDHPAYKELGDYLPRQNETRLLFVVRCATTDPLTQKPCLKLFPAGEWEVPAREALQALTFISPNPGSLPLVAEQDIELVIPKWRAYGRVEIRELNKPGHERKYYSRVMFQNIASGQKVGTYWCWPY